VKPIFPFLIASTCISVFGCTYQSSDDKMSKATKFSGHYNEFSGKLSDGTELSGIAWFRTGSSVGDFCFQAREMVCTGKYSSNSDLRIGGKFDCTNQITGVFRAKRVRDGSYVTPTDVSGELSDGRTASVSFSRVKKGSGTTICYK